MIRFIFVRLITGLLVVFLVSVATFLMFFAAPNDVARTMAGKAATPETIALINHRLGLDQPLWHQYGHFIWRALHGDLGYDYYHQRSVVSIIKGAAPVSLSIAFGAAILWMILGVGSGIISAVRPRSFMDRALNVLALIFYSMPTFVLGSMLLFFLYFKLTSAGHAWFPAAGYVPWFGKPDPSNPQHGFWPWMHHLILPWVTLALVTAAAYTRFTRGSMLEVLSEDYIRTARAKGISERRVVFRHALRSALTPVVTQFGIDLAILAGGTVVTEQLFGMHGLGWNSLTAITNQDLPVIVGILLVVSVFVVVANFLVDLIYAVLDPRVRLY
ncbi:ABC transporter permease [Nocardioides nematodiphilus]|uniref:ABC transporter permease n=1 Tax=Nocardioides nematodiphilus TaxID=2849669 RepID=UPI001CD97597|nr:ABC transporter permease [Nocardioides nematodiphilus]MCA1982750.1 ABC transporter permease [Nocardioides nematodiphilus]